MEKKKKKKKKKNTACDRYSRQLELYNYRNQENAQ